MGIVAVYGVRPVEARSVDVCCWWLTAGRLRITLFLFCRVGIVALASPNTGGVEGGAIRSSLEKILQTSLEGHSITIHLKDVLLKYMLMPVLCKVCVRSWRLRDGFWGCEPNPEILRTKKTEK